jgi:uncharacterized protein (DUF433 family)
VTRLVIETSNICAGLPRIEHTRITTQQLRRAFIGGATVDALADLHSLTRLEVEGALRFELRNDVMTERETVGRRYGR